MASNTNGGQDKGSQLPIESGVLGDNTAGVNSFDSSYFEGYDEQTKSIAIQICSLLTGREGIDTIKLLGKIRLSIVGKSSKN